VHLRAGAPVLPCAAVRTPARSLLALALAGAALSAAARPAAAQQRPSTGKLVAVGAVTAVPTYWLDVVLHEGSHALMGKAFGGEILEFHVLPGRYGPARNFYFGYVRYRGQLTVGQRTLFLLAPKLQNLIWLGGYAALVGTGATPDNHYAQVVLAVLATGFWIDFTKDLVQFWHPADVDVALEINGARTVWKRLPWRLLHLGLSAAAAVVLYQGWRAAFDRPDPAAAMPVLVPVVGGRF